MSGRRKLYHRIAVKTGMKYHEIRVKLAKVGTEAAKKLLVEALGEEGAKYPGEAWFKVLSFTMPITFKLAREKLAIPTVDEVISAVKSTYPNWEAEVKKAYEETLSYTE